MQHLDSSDLRTYATRSKALTRLLVKDGLPYALARNFAEDALLKQYVSTPLVISIALRMSKSGLRSCGLTPTPSSGDTPGVGEQRLRELQDAVRSGLPSRNSLGSPTSNSSPVLTRKQRRAQDRMVAKFLKGLQRGSASPTSLTPGTKSTAPTSTAQT